MLLSDGTGAGEDASRGSGRVLDLMEKMLEAGFDTEESVNMLNSALYAQNEEEDHPTVDICSLDLYSGECEICKVGGAATFLKESGGTECIGGESLPLGIFQKAQTEVRVRQLAAGDLLIMMTDGVLDALEDECERADAGYDRGIGRTESAGDRREDTFLCHMQLWGQDPG